MLVNKPILRDRVRNQKIILYASNNFHQMKKNYYYVEPRHMKVQI